MYTYVLSQSFSTTELFLELFENIWNIWLFKLHRMMAIVRQWEFTLKGMTRPFLTTYFLWRASNGRSLIKNLLKLKDAFGTDFRQAWLVATYLLFYNSNLDEGNLLCNSFLRHHRHYLVFGTCNTFIMKLKRTTHYLLQYLVFKGFFHLTFEIC